jgi:hypothetical protein
MTTAKIGHNNPPSPIDEIKKDYASYLMEVENWTDGELVQNEEQMKVVDELRNQMRRLRLSLEKGQEEATAPLYKAYKDEMNVWKPEITSIKNKEDCLVQIVGDFKKKAAEEQRKKEREAQLKAEQARIEAEKAVAQAGNLKAIEEAQAKQEAARQAQKELQDTKAQKVKGLRTVTKYEITDRRTLVNWIARNRKTDIDAFLDEWARKNHKSIPADGLRVWEEKEAF